MSLERKGRGIAGQKQKKKHQQFWIFSAESLSCMDFEKPSSLKGLEAVLEKNVYWKQRSHLSPESCVSWRSWGAGWYGKRLRGEKISKRHRMGGQTRWKQKCVLCWWPVSNHKYIAKRRTCVGKQYPADLHSIRAQIIPVRGKQKSKGKYKRE